MEKYIGDISKGKEISFIEINSYVGESFESKLNLAKLIVEKNKNLLLFDEDKQPIGNVELDEKSATIYINEKLAEITERERILEEKESNKVAVEEIKQEIKVAVKGRPRK